MMTPTTTNTERESFDTVLQQLLSLHQEANEYASFANDTSRTSERGKFDSVLKELIAQRENAVVMKTRMENQANHNEEMAKAREKIAALEAREKLSEEMQRERLTFTLREKELAAELAEVKGKLASKAIKTPDEFTSK